MLKQRFSLSLSLVCLFILLTMTPVYAQREPRVEEFLGQLVDYDDVIFYDIYNLEAGETLYVYAEALQPTLDPMIAVGDIDFEEVLAVNDDIDYPDNLNAALAFEIPEDGDYSVAITAATEDSPAGKYRILFGIDAPDVLDGDAEPTGDRIAVLYVGDDQTASPIGSALENADVRVQELTGRIDDETEEIAYTVTDAQRGDVLYVYAEATRGDLDTVLYVTDADFEDVLAENDDIDYPANTDSALRFVIPEDGDYVIIVRRYDDSTSGDFRLLVGFNEPDVLDGDANPTGDAFVFLGDAPDDSNLPDNTVTDNNARVEEFTGTIDDGQDRVFYDLFDVQAGETIYVYVEATSGNLDTVLLLGDIDFTEVLAQNDDLAPNNRNSALEFIVPETGDYSISVTRYDESSSGDYRLLIGINAPEVLSGDAIPTGDRVAVLYGSRDSIPMADCSELFERPRLSGPEKTYETRYFVLHYTLRGDDAADEEFVEEIARIVDSIWRYQVIEEGWPAPPPDCGEGGDRRYDIYLRDILGDGVLGYAQPEGLIGDNPASPAVEEYAAYSYLVIDNDYEDYGDPYEVVLATLAHEFHHAIQFGYDINDEAGWYYEATATWMETQNYPDVEEATPYIDNLFQTTDLCIGATPDDDDYDLRIYAEWVLIDSIARDFGTQAVREMWDLIAVEENMDAFYVLADSHDTTPQEIVLRMAVRNLLLDYSLAPRFNTTVRVEAVIDGEGVFEPDEGGVQELGVDYVLIEVAGLYTFEIDGDDLVLYVVGIDENEDSADVFELGESGTVDTEDYDYAYVIVLNTAQHDDPADCDTTDWELTVSEGDEDDLLEPLDFEVSIENFEPGD